MTIKLTPAQKRYLLDLLADGERTYNGRAWRTLNRLNQLELVGWRVLHVEGDSVAAYRTHLTPKGVTVAQELQMAVTLEGSR